MSKNTRTRILLTAVAALLLVTMAVGGTLAYLKASTGTITNNFVGSTVSVSIEETEKENYQFVPGVDISKDPKVTATADVDAYVFVKIDETNWPASVPYTLAEGWKVVDGATEKVYYRELTPDEGKIATSTWSVLANDEIPVPAALTKEEIAAFFKDAEGTAQEVKLAFSAYIFQMANGDVDFAPLAAWNLAKTN